MKRRILAALIVFSTTGAAYAQSDRLLESVRLHDRGARALAEKELAACDQKACEDLARLSLLAGFLALSEGEQDRAFQLLEPRSAPQGLGPWHQFYLGQAAFYRRDYQRAAKAFTAIVEVAPPSLRARTVARLGEALLMADDPRAALPHLEEAANAHGTPELLFQRAQARLSTGNAAGAKADWVLLALKHPAHPFGEASVQALGALRPAYRFSFEERLTRAQGLVDAGRAEAALAELAVIDAQKLGRGGTAKAKMAQVHVLALFAQNKDAEVEPHLNAAKKGPKSLSADVAMLRAHRALKKNDRPRARALFAEAAKKFPKERATEEALFFAAWLDLQQLDFEGAVKTFAQFEKQRPQSRKLDEALWFKALAQLRMQQYAAVRDTLAGLQARHPKSSLVPQAKYWSARAGQLSGMKGDGLLPRYRELVALHPGSFYALMAQERLKELGVTPPVAFPEKTAELKGAKVPPQLSDALALTRAGLYRDANLEVQAQLSTLRDRSDALVWGHALQGIGEFGAAYAVAARMLWGPVFTEKKPEAVALLYPRAFRSAVEKEAARHQLPVSLIWAIMRRESAFKPEVASFADARGLMQIIPPTANAIAKELGEDAPPPDALFAPEVNIRYGAWYLAKLTERFGHPALVAASYNAGPPAVSRWVEQDGTLPLDLFVELIPYKETRGYVKQVVADVQLYQALYVPEEQATSVPMTLPVPKAAGVNF